jgi:hypothetical protein
MSEHVFARISGYHLTILPLAPFEYRQSADDDFLLFLSHTTSSTTKQAMLRVDDHGYHVELAPTTASFDEVAELRSSTYAGAWLIETTVFAVCWPGDFAFVSPADAASPSVFDLVGPDNALIYVQGPFVAARLPALTDMAAPGQAITATGTTNERHWVELAYEHEAMTWLQRHYVIPFIGNRALVVTMQTPQQQASRTISAAELLLQTLAPVQADE